jgi:hypothetical protein
LNDPVSHQGRQFCGFFRFLVNALATREHRDESLELRRAHLRLLARAESIEDRVTIRAIDRLEEQSRLLVSLKCLREIVRRRHGCRLLSGVRGVSLPALLRRDQHLIVERVVRFSVE